MLKLKCFLLCLCFVLARAADSTTAAADGDSNVAAASQPEPAIHDVAIADKPQTLSGFPSELSFLPTGIISHVVTGGVVAIGVVILAVLASLFYPFSSVRGLCDLTNSCATSNYRVDTFPAPGVLSANTNTQYADTYNSPYSQPGAFSPTYQKRSVDYSYVGPILKMLNAAYDKYTAKPYSNSITAYGSEKTQNEERRRKR